MSNVINLRPTSALLRDISDMEHKNDLGSVLDRMWARDNLELGLKELLTKHARKKGARPGRDYDLKRVAADLLKKFVDNQKEDDV